MGLTAFSLLLTLLGVIGLVTAFQQRSSVTSDGPSLLVLLFAVGTTATVLLLPGYTSYPLGLLTVLLACGSTYYLSSTQVVGSSDEFARLSWFGFGVLVAWCSLVDGLTGSGIYEGRWIGYVVAGLLWLVTGHMMSYARLSNRSLALMGLFILSLLLIPAIFMQSTFWLPCKVGDLEKCSVAGALFKSFASSENVVGIIGAFALIAAVQSATGRLRIVCVLVSASTILLSGSRTAYVTLGVAILWYVVGSVVERRRKIYSVPFSIGLTLALAAAATSTYLMYAATPESFSRRGRIWIAVCSQVGDRILQGVGLSKWVYFQTLGEAPDHFFHSGYALLYFSGGLVALILLAIVVAGLLAAKAESGRALTERSPVVLFAVYSFTETIWNPLAVDTYSWIVVALFLSVAGSSYVKAKSAAEERELARSR